MTNPIGLLTAADEGLGHQIVDTFAVTGTSDLSWTEKVCAMAAARDGSLQIGFGLGRYNNRNVMDAYAGASRGVEQTTVRASRSLGTDPLTALIGPIRYEVVEPLRQIRFMLEPNDIQPYAFDWLFEGAFPPAFEHRNLQRTGNRISAELVRYHQIGRCSGWVEIDGTRTEMHPDTWVSTRDHSWGVRYGIGQPVTDVEPHEGIGNYHFFWTPNYLERPDGSAYGIFMVFNHFRRPGSEHREIWGLVEHPDGRVENIAEIVPELSYDPSNRRLHGGRVHCTMADGAARTSGSKSSPTPDSIWAPGCTSDSTVTTTVNGEARCRSTANASTTAPPPRTHVASTKSATPWCASPIPPAAAPAGATGSPSWPASTLNSG